MGKKIFISKSHYDRYQKFKCPLNLGFWHYSPNGCCLFINEKTQTIHHLYLRESCSLSKDGQTIQKLLAKNQHSKSYNESDNDDDDEYNNIHNNENTLTNTNNEGEFLNVILQPYLNNAITTTSVDQRLLNNMNVDSKNKLLSFHDEILQQYWFVVCDTNITFDENRKHNSEAIVQHLLLKNLYCPLVFCCNLETLSAFIGTVTNRFIHIQMPILNNMPADRLQRKLLENIKFVSQFPANNMLRIPPANNLCYMDSRDLFDVVKNGHSGFLTTMRPIHITNEINFLDTWRRILFNFVHELVNIHNFEKQNIRIRSACNVAHFLKGNNKSVIPEFRCDVDQKNKCIYLKTRRKEYEMFRINSQTTEGCGKHGSNYTIGLSDEGIICRHVLEAMVDEYGEDEVDKKLNFHCLFTHTVFEQNNASLWERVVYESLGLGRQLTLKDGSSVSRERIACMQLLCQQKRMNDIHRFCLPKRFLTLYWFQWACGVLKLNVFDQN